MEILITIFFIGLCFYSIIGGIIIFGEYSETPVDSKIEKEKRKQFSGANKIFLTKLIKYTLIIIIPTYFWQNIYEIVGSDIKIENEYHITMLAVPLFLWANTILVAFVLSLDYLNKKLKNIFKK